MEILLDEMYTGLKPFLEALGWKVSSVEDVGLKGAADKEVVEYAERHGMVLVTQEHKVAELARLKGIECVFVGPAEVTRVIDGKLRELEKAGK